MVRWLQYNIILFSVDKYQQWNFIAFYRSNVSCYVGEMEVWSAMPFYLRNRTELVQVFFNCHFLFAPIDTEFRYSTGVLFIESFKRSVNGKKTIFDIQQSPCRLNKFVGSQPPDHTRGSWTRPINGYKIIILKLANCTLKTKYCLSKIKLREHN